MPIMPIKLPKHVTQAEEALSKVVPIVDPDPKITLTQKFRDLDRRIQSKHEAAEKQIERSSSAIQEFGRCATESKTRLSIKAFLPCDLGLDEDQDKEEDD